MSLGSDYLRSLLEEDPERGVYRCKREMFTDPRLFELEMKHIFEGNWVYLAHESQVAGINDYLTTQIGRQSIVIARNRDGQLNAFINACSHRGAMLCRHKSGNRSSYTCPFHGWTFNNSGKLLKVKDPAEAGYPQGFNCKGSHDLTRVARFESYRGFLFGSLNPDVRPLAEHLGGPHVQQIARVARQDVAAQGARHAGQDIGADPCLAGHRVQLPAELLALVDELDDAVQQVAGIAAITVVDRDAQGEDAQLLNLVEFGDFLQRLRQVDAEKHVVARQGEDVAQRLLGILHCLHQRVAQRAPGVQAAHHLVEETRHLPDHSLQAALVEHAQGDAAGQRRQ